MLAFVVHMMVFVLFYISTPVTFLNGKSIIIYIVFAFVKLIQN